MILFSVISALLLAFYYNPSDPTFKTGFIIPLTVLSIWHSYKILISLLQFFSKKIVRFSGTFSYNTPASINKSLWLSQQTYLRTSSLRI